MKKNNYVSENQAISDTLHKEQGERLKKLRNRAGLSQEAFGLEVNMSRSNIARAEKNGFDENKALLFANFFNVDKEYLMCTIDFPNADIQNFSDWVDIYNYTFALRKHSLEIFNFGDYRLYKCCRGSGNRVSLNLSGYEEHKDSKFSNDPDYEDFVNMKHDDFVMYVAENDDIKEETESTKHDLEEDGVYYLLVEKNRFYKLTAEQFDLLCYELRDFADLILKHSLEREDATPFFGKLKHWSEEWKD